MTLEDIQHFLVNEAWIDAVILTFMLAVAVAVAVIRNLFASVMLMGIFSLLSAILFVVLDAVDVAFTEAAVGAGISVVLFLGAMVLIPHQKPEPRQRIVSATLVCLVCGGLLIAGTLDMPLYGDPDSPVQRHVGNEYIQKSLKETGVPNVVTAVLASYRGYDTLGETVVIFTAAVGIILLMGGRRLYRRKVVD